MSNLGPEQAKVDNGGAAVTLDYATPQEKTWQAGTLTYNRAALVKLFGWLLWGDLALYLRERTLGGLMTIFWVRMKASNTLIWVIGTLLTSIINIPLGPIISYMSDRHRGPRGRRRPFLLLGVPLAALCIVGMGLAPMIGGWLHHALAIERWAETTTIIGCFAVFFLAFDVAAVISGSVFGAFCNDVIPREVLGRFWGLARAVSIGVQILCMFWLMGYAQKYLTTIYICVGLIYGVGYSSAILMVREGQYPPPESTGSAASGPLRNLVRALVSYLKACFSKPFYLCAFAAMIAPAMAFSAIYGYAQLFATKNLGMTAGDYFWWTGLYFVLTLPLAPLQGWLADKIHPLRVAMIVMALHVPACLWGWFYIDDKRTFAIAFVLTGLFQVLYNTAVSALWPIIFRRDVFAQLGSAAGLISTVVMLLYRGPIARMLDYTAKANSTAIHAGSKGDIVVLAPCIYQYTFLLAGLMSIVALVVLMVMYKKFNELGGTKGYVAP